MKVLQKICFIVAAVAAFTCSAAAFTACDRKGSGLTQEVDPTRTQLYVSNYNGGYGNEWLHSAIRRFEEKYAEVPYETGKKGVQVMVMDSKNVGTSVLSTISSSPAEVFFTEGVYMSDFVKGGYVEDITDIVTEKLTDYGENKSIEEKLTDAQKDYFGMLESDNKVHYYMLPHYQSFRGLIYDVDLFNEEKLFIAKNGAPSETMQEGGSFTEYKFTNEKGERSAGPDGEYGTYDDGLPATYQEFYALCDRMGSKGIVPISYSGAVQVYYDDFLTALEADVEGLSNMMANYNFSGEVSSVVDLTTLSSDGLSYRLADPFQMSNREGYMMARVEGKLKALQFTESLIRGGKYGSYFSSNCFDSTSNIENQSQYLYGRYGGDKVIAMIVEGSFWENEAAGVFESMEIKLGEQTGRYARRFAYMPFPKADDKRIGERLTLVDSLLSAGFIKSGLPDYKNEIAKNFLQFVNTDVSLREFNVLTGAPKSLEYELTKEDLGKISYFGKSLINIRNDENTDIVYPASSNAIYRSSPSSFFSDAEWNAVINGSPYSHPQQVMHDVGFSAVQMFKGISNRLTEEAWKNAYSSFF